MSTSCMVGAVGIEIAPLNYKSFKERGVAPLPLSNWSLLEPSSFCNSKPLRGTRPAESLSLKHCQRICGTQI